MESEKLKKRKVQLSNSIIPWFIGLSDDLMFFIAINTLFFTVVKGLTAAQITFLNTITTLSYILIHRTALKIMQKIKNVTSIRIGTIMLLCSSILITFGNNYLTIIIGHILYGPAFIFKKMDNIVLENNLRYLNKQDNYVKKLSESKIIYSIITTVIALVAGRMFAINHYLPMYLCIGICAFNFLLSFCIFDVNENTQKNHENNKKVKIKFTKITTIIFISYALLYGIVSTGQNNTKLFIQYNLSEYFNVGLTATYLSFIIVTSRIFRIFGNLMFQKTYRKHKDKVILLLPIMLIAAFSCILLGKCFNPNILIKFLLMTIGFDIILGIRDWIEIYTSNLLLKNTEKHEHKEAISYLGLSRRIGSTILSLLFSLMLIKLDLIYVIICLLIFSIISFIINSKLYKMVKQT